MGDCEAVVMTGGGSMRDPSYPSVTPHEIRSFHYPSSPGNDETPTIATIKILSRAEKSQSTSSRGMLRCSHLINYLIIWNTVFQIVMSQSSTNRNCFMGLRKPPGAGRVLRLQLTVQWSRENDKKKNK